MPGRIPLPTLPLPPFVQPPTTTAAKKPIEIPVGPFPIVCSSSFANYFAFTSQKEPEKRPEVKKKEQPGCPPGPPPDLIEMREFDSDYESEEEEPKSKKLKSVRHEEVSEGNDCLVDDNVQVECFRYQIAKMTIKTKIFLSNNRRHCNSECWRYQVKTSTNL